MNNQRGFFIFLGVLILTLLPVLLWMSIFILIVSIFKDKEEAEPDAFKVVEEFFITVRFGTKYLWEGLTGKAPLGF